MQILKNIAHGPKSNN